MNDKKIMKYSILDVVSSMTKDQPFVERKALRKNVLFSVRQQTKQVDDDIKELFKKQLQKLIDTYLLLYDLDNDSIQKNLNHEYWLTSSSNHRNYSSNEQKRSHDSLDKSIVSLEECDKQDDSSQIHKKIKSNPTLHESSYPSIIKPTGSTTILLFYAYCNPPMTRHGQDQAILQCSRVLNQYQISGRLRIGREGYNATLTGPYDGIRAFTHFLREYDPTTFEQTDFKYVDHQPDNQKLKNLKVWPVTEIVTYGFDPKDAPLDMRGIHLKPQEFHEALTKPNTVLIDVRNFNETLIGRFNPPSDPNIGEKVLDPNMRRSTDFPKWVEEKKQDLFGKQVLMCCTAGVRCERASAFLKKKGIENVYQLEGGIHRYLDTFPEDGGYWEGKNYTFDKRFSHGAAKSKTISVCILCNQPWDRYQAQKKCYKCDLEVLVCKSCQRLKPPPDPNMLCPLCIQERKKKTSIK